MMIFVGDNLIIFSKKLSLYKYDKLKCIQKIYTKLGCKLNNILTYMLKHLFDNKKGRKVLKGKIIVLR